MLDGDEVDLTTYEYKVLEYLVLHPEEATEEMLAADSPFMKERMQWVEAQEEKAARDPKRRLDLSDMPKFGEVWQRSLSETLVAMAPGLAVLVLTFGLSILITFMRFLRYDPR